MGSRSLEIGKVLLGDGYRLGIVGHGNVDNAIFRLHINRANFLRPENTESAAFDHHRTAHPDVGILGGNNHITASKQGCVARKAGARYDAYYRDPAAQSGELAKGG